MNRWAVFHSSRGCPQGSALLVLPDRWIPAVGAVDHQEFRARDTGAVPPATVLAALGRLPTTKRRNGSARYSAPTPSRRTSALRRFASRWLPGRGRSRGSRRAGVLVFVVLAAALVAGVVVSVWGARPRVEDAPPQLTPPAAAPTSSPPQELVVSVVGRVARPGLVTLAPGDRVADAVRAAGGPLPDTDLTPLNLARRLTDGSRSTGIPAPPQSPGRRNREIEHEHGDR